MTIKEFLSRGPRLDCLILLEDCLKIDRSRLLAHTEQKLSSTQANRLNRQLKRRMTGEPLAYIRQQLEFYGRGFYVDKRVLTPRPETETMIDLLKELVDTRQLTPNSQLQIADIGTGSGCLAITAKLEIPNLNVWATDTSRPALAVARRNARLHSVNLKFFQGDLLLSLPATIYQLPTTILANLPYVPDRYKVNAGVRYEPRQAIFGGSDGLDIYRRFFTQIFALPRLPKYILTESLPPQHAEMTKLAAQSGYKLAKTDGMVQLFTL